MKTADCDILIVPGLDGSGPEHWQSRWEDRLSTARRVAQDSWDRPVLANWTGSLLAAVAEAKRPVILVAHSLGVPTVVHAAPTMPEGAVLGAFLVAMADPEATSFPPSIDTAFAPLPRDPLPFPSLLVASRNDPFCTYERAEDLSYAWGALLVDAGEAGHINPDSGFGPWPEGLMRFAGFLRGLGTR